MKIAMDPIGSRRAGRFTFMSLLQQYLIEQGDEIVEPKDSEVYITHGYDLTKEKVQQVRDMGVKLVVRQDGWAPSVYERMIKENFLSDWLSLLSGVDRVIYQSEFCVEMFKRFDHDTSNGIVIHNGVEIPWRGKKYPIFVIYTTKGIGDWWKRLIDQTIEYISDWCMENGLACVEVRKNTRSQLPHTELLALFEKSMYVAHLYPFAPCANTLLEAVAADNVVFAFGNGGDPELTVTDLLIPLTRSRFDFPDRGVHLPRDVVWRVLDKAKDRYSFYEGLLRKMILEFDYRVIGKKYRDVCKGVI